MKMMKNRRRIKNTQIIILIMDEVKEVMDHPNRLVARLAKNLRSAHKKARQVYRGSKRAEHQTIKLPFSRHVPSLS